MDGTVLSWVFGLNALLLIGLSIPLVRRRVRPNRFYGFRTPSTLNDERLWYHVNAKAGVDLLMVGVGLSLIVLVNWIAKFQVGTFAAIAIAWTTVGLLWSTVHGFAILGRRRT
jgi:hypothetical protein